MDMASIAKIPEQGQDKETQNSKRVNEVWFEIQRGSSKEFILYASPDETLVMILDQEQAYFSCLMKEHKGTKFDCRYTGAFIEQGWDNEKISVKRDICKSDGQEKEKICPF